MAGDGKEKSEYILLAENVHTLKLVDTKRYHTLYNKFIVTIIKNFTLANADCLVFTTCPTHIDELGCCNDS